jgi:hypothetical protein
MDDIADNDDIDGIYRHDDRREPTLLELQDDILQMRGYFVILGSCILILAVLLAVSVAMNFVGVTAMERDCLLLSMMRQAIFYLNPLTMESCRADFAILFPEMVLP